METQISFVVLTWNSERHVRSCIESVLGLGCICADVYVIDNGSSDDTLGILRDLAATDARLHVCRLGCNMGTTIPRNMGLRRLASGTTHVCVLDSDTIVNRAAFETMLDALARHPEVGVVGPSMASSSGDVQLSGRNMPSLSLKLHKAFPFGRVAERAEAEEAPSAPVVDGLQDVGYLLSACWLMPVSSFEIVGLFDEAIFYAPEDVDWCLRCHKAALRVCLCPDAQIVHEYQRLSHQKFFSKTNIEHLKGLMYFFRKHGYLFKAPAF